VNLRLIVTILVIAAAPVCAQAQKPTPAKVTKADAQKVLKIGSMETSIFVTDLAQQFSLYVARLFTTEDANGNGSCA
jgi:hypothetical protein